MSSDTLIAEHPSAAAIFLAAAEQVPNSPPPIKGDNLLTQMLMSIRLENRWNECLDSWIEAEAEEVLEVHLLAAQVRDQLFEVVNEINHDEELQQAIVLVYFQVKAYWYLLNLRLGYSIEGGILDQAVAYRAALLAILVTHIEGVLGKAVQQRVSAMLDSALEGDQLLETTAAPAPGNNHSSNGSLSDWADGSEAEESESLRSRVRALADTLGEMSDRLAQQSGEMVTLKATHTALKNVTDETEPSQIVARVLTMRAQVSALGAEVHSTAARRELFEREFGTSDPIAIAAQMGALRAQLAQPGASSGGGRGPVRNDSGTGPSGASTDSQRTELLTRLQEMDDSLRTERDARITAQTRSATLQAEVESLRAGRTLFQTELNLTDAAEIVAMVKGLQNRLATLQDLESLLGTMETELSISAV